ncbi:MAG: type III pantothenate kinase [Candidatus Ruthia sp.]|nr:type III pantothenate kinase [Candidatus Ruthturnera sp.]MBT4668368.1 type III pantothenate kinase [Candidatus Ruthturnera sp.]
MCQSNLFIDIGNTAVKWLFNSQYQSALVSEFNLTLLPKAGKVFASCVGDQSLLQGLDNVVFVESQSQFKNFISSYQNSTELGTDRFLAMIATIDQYPNQTRLIIDAGSALTFDLVLANGAHQGGLIMPGLGKLRRSFDKFSSDSHQLSTQKLADNTQDAWELGTGQMFASMINTQIEYYLDKFGDLLVVLTGGDSKILALKLNHAVKLHQNLALEGLVIYAQTHTD